MRKHSTLSYFPALLITQLATQFVYNTHWYQRNILNKVDFCRYNVCHAVWN